MVKALYRKFWIYIVWSNGIIGVIPMFFNTVNNVTFWIGVTLYLIVLIQIIGRNHHWQRTVRLGRCIDCSKCKHNEYCDKSSISNIHNEKAKLFIKQFLGH